MMTTIAADGTHIINTWPGTTNGSTKHTGASTVTATSNDDSATITLGEAVDDEGTGFVAYPTSATNFAEPEFVQHGQGALLKVQVSGITANSVVIRWRPA